MTRTLLHLCILTVATVNAAIPEPDVVFYGRVTRSPASTPHVPTGVAWTINGNAETLAANQTQIVVVNTETFYLSRIPFETRKLADNTPLATTAGTLGLATTAVSYSRSVTVDGRNAVLPPGTGTFSYGANVQGLMEQLDLVIGENFTEWSQRVFGTLVNPNDDADGDGSTNYQEYTAGTDPQNPASRLFVKTFAKNAGGVTFSWDATEGKTYTVERSTNLSTWNVLQNNVAGTAGVASFTDPNTAGNPKFFYRVNVNPGP
jgi:hypothetical protein